MKRLRSWPQGLVGQTILVLVCAVVLESIGSAWIGERVAAAASARSVPWFVAAHGLGSVLILTLGVLVAAGLLVRELGAPLRNLTEAAESVGAGKEATVPEQGPRDLRRVARAFNTMQARILDLTRSRTQALAAVSHDLRTPLARMRLRTASVSDPEDRRGMEADIDEMSAMIGSVLSYLKGFEPETPRLGDLAAIAMTVVDDAVDRGASARYVGPNHAVTTGRLLSIKRALTNLVDNAVLYGGGARVTLSQATDGGVTLTVEDSGPGIAPEALNRVLEPFLRLDEARARNTRGLGLGLSIVAQIAEREGGRLTLENRREGGLRATLRLPAAAP